MPRRLYPFVAAAAAAVSILVPALRAGPINPPAGPVTSTNKTLAEIEPRINVQSLPGNSIFQYTITQSGSYYLSADIIGVSGKGAIGIIGAGQVTLDLNGFAITGVSGATNGIFVGTLIRVSIRNGRLMSWPTHGLTASGAGASDFQDLEAELCGGNGLDLGDNARITRCSARQNTGKGIRLGGGSIITDSLATSNGTGIEINSGSRVSGCTVGSNTAEGILVGGTDGVAENNVVSITSASASGIRVSGSRNRISNNTVSGNLSTGQIGLNITGTANIIQDNTVRQTTDNYSFATGNQLSLIISQLPESLDWPCVARLAGSLTPSSAGVNGIVVNSDSVTIDLNNQELVGPPGNSTGIVSAGANRRNVTIRNGAVRGWGSNGINLTGCIAPQVIGVRALANLGIGILTPGGSVLDCVAQGNIGAGISAGDQALVARCQAQGNGGDNIIVSSNSTVTDCSATGSTGGNGINASGLYNAVNRCTANANALNGINAAQRTRVSDCAIFSNTQNGVHISFGGTIERCTIGNNSGCGVLEDAGGGATIRDNTISEHANANTAGVKIVTAGLCRIEGNHFIGNWRSVDVSVIANMISRNSSALVGAGGHYTISVGNTYGPIVNVSNVGDITGTANSNHPQANFAY